jgi:hypothetical protein
MYKKVTKVKEYFTKDGKNVYKKTTDVDMCDTVVTDMTFLLRLLEYVRETVMSDVELHTLADILQDKSEDYIVLHISHYDEVIKELNEKKALATVS